MTKEELEKGQELLKDIAKLEEEKKQWESAETIRYIEVADTFPEERYTQYHNVASWLDFSEVKMLTLAKINKRLDELHREFNNL